MFRSRLPTYILQFFVRDRTSPSRTIIFLNSILTEDVLCLMVCRHVVFVDWKVDGEFVAPYYDKRNYKKWNPTPSESESLDRTCPHWFVSAPLVVSVLPRYLADCPRDFLPHAGLWRRIFVTSIHAANCY
ncbi:hypothetical protein KCU91_g67, partial [Aureobasidium melanogenum]